MLLCISKVHMAKDDAFGFKAYWCKICDICVFQATKRTKDSCRKKVQGTIKQLWEMWLQAQVKMPKLEIHSGIKYKYAKCVGDNI